ncbi:ABC transporter permease [Nocardia nova]
MATKDIAPMSRNARRLTPFRWLFPVVVVSLVAALLGLLYLDYVVDPERNLHDFPIALVNQDVGETLGTPGHEQRVNFGDQVADGLRAAVPADEIDLRVLGLPEAQRQMQNGQVYGAVVIPSDFSKRLGILGVGSVIPGEIEQPIITLQTNPRIGAFATQIVARFGARALPQINDQVGKQLTEQVQAQLTPPPGGAPAPELTGATRLALQQPLQIVTQEFHPLPGGSGEGLTAFFYALLLLLAGMVGAMIVHTLIDSTLGFIPTEYGPWYVHYPVTPVSRTRTLLIKWGVMAVTALVVSGIFVGIGAALGMPLDNPLGLYLYGVLAIIAVGFTGISILAAIGSAGLLVNMILFIVLGLPSSGGTVPIEATPKYLGWLATFEPMHQVFLAVRALLYFDGSGPAGFTRGFWMTMLGLVIGVVLGLVVTRFYDRKGLERKPINRTAAAASSG